MTWIEASKTHPCPICGKPKWCTRTADGEIARCMQSEGKGPDAIKPSRGGGWIHRLRERTSFAAQPNWQPRALLRRAPDWTHLVAERVATTDDNALAHHAGALGVSLPALRALSCFVSPRYRNAVCAPMFDATRAARGVRLRYLNGCKLAVRGSREGVFMPAKHADGGTLAVVEGFSDAAAGLDLAPALDWIGRPSCTGASAIIVEIVRTRRPQLVVLIADADEPGQAGAARLAAELRLYCADVRIVTPPAPAKDLRAWVLAGARCEDLTRMIEAAPCVPAPRISVRP